MSENARHNLKQLFCYIRALAERRFAIVQRYGDYSFNMELSALKGLDMIDLPSFGNDEESIDPELILCAGKAEYEPCPALPDCLSGWLEKGWNDPERTPAPIDSRDFETADAGVTRTELFSDSEDRRGAYNEWLAQREEWAQDALPQYRSRKIYEQLYSLYSKLEREKDRLELMVGDGIFETVLDDGTVISHPIVIERAKLTFNSNVPCFTVSDLDSGPLLYTRLLRTIPGLESTCLSGFSAQLEQEQIHPFEGERFDMFLSAFANAISSECEISTDSKKSSARFTVRRGAVLFVRPTASGYGAMLDKIIDDIDNAAEFSPSLLSIIGESDNSGADDISVGLGAMEVNGIDSEVLLEKASNREQLLIAKKIAHSPAVLVQGPPGTGKTHTISNIIGDLLAQGKSVLVSSQTSKALSVLRDKISEPIQPLCVSLLDDNRKQLEQSLNTINDYISSHNVESLDAEADRFKKERDAVIAKMSESKAKLIELVSQEYAPLPNGMTPKEAAQYIASMDESAFIPDSVQFGATLPLSADELKELYQTNTSLTAKEEALLASCAPDSSTLPSPARFRQVCAMVKRTDEELTARGVDYWAADTQRNADELLSLCEELKKQRERFSSAEQWKLTLAQSAIGENADGNGVFESIGKAIPELKASAAALKLSLIDSKPHIPDELITADTCKLLDEIHGALEGEKINWLVIATHLKWKPLLDRCVINGEKPDTRTEVGILAEYCRLLLGRRTLIRRWESAVQSTGAPAISGDTPEEQAAAAWPIVSGWLNWYSAEWQPITEKLTQLGFDIERYREKQPLESRMSGEIEEIKAALLGDLPEIVEDEYYRGDRSECSALLDETSRKLLPFINDFNLINELRGCVERRDEDGYSSFFDQYDIICLKREQFARRIELLDRLSTVCPDWSSEIASRSGVNGGDSIPAPLDEHWLRAQLRGLLEAHPAGEIAQVQTLIEQLNSQLSDLTRELITRRAWSAQLRTMQDQTKKRALAEWVELVKRIGKGTGKRAEQLLASGDLRRAMKACRRSVPVWIMPMSAVAENFEPSDEKFDVLIIDEASQADLTALISLYLAKKVIVVGDDKQVSPSPIGLDLETTNKLRQEFLSEIPGAAMYDELVSIYDLGKANYEPITLREHFRCADDIINYSNYYTYGGNICPLRDSRSIKLHPSTVAYRVPDGESGGKKTNRSEAAATAALIVACTEQPEYAHSTFGVITMLGDEQALIIDRLLREKLSESAYQSRAILCGNPSYFQGDERDVIFISLVDSGKENGKQLAVRREGYNELYAKRYNVAASRARDQLWVVHSLDPENDLKSDDIRLTLIRHAENPAATAEALEKKQAAALSAMEQAVSKRLSAEGYTVTARQKVGSYIVAMTCEGKGGRVAVECDGDVATEREVIISELNKQSVLERLGWRFIRLRASEYYRAPEEFFSALIAQIAAFGIKPGAADSSSESDLVERVIARAAQLREQWGAKAISPEAEAAAAAISNEDIIAADIPEVMPEIAVENADNANAAQDSVEVAENSVDAAADSADAVEDSADAAQDAAEAAADTACDNAETAAESNEATANQPESAKTADDQ